MFKKSGLTLFLTAITLLGCEEKKTEQPVTTNPAFVNYWQDQQYIQAQDNALKAAEASNKATPDSCDGLDAQKDNTGRVTYVDMHILYISRDGQIRALSTFTLDLLNPRFREIGYVHSNGSVLYNLPSFNAALNKAKTETPPDPTLTVEMAGIFSEEAADVLRFDATVNTKVQNKITKGDTTSTHYFLLDEEQFNEQVARAGECVTTHQTAVTPPVTPTPTPATPTTP